LVVQTVAGMTSFLAVLFDPIFLFYHILLLLSSIV